MSHIVLFQASRLLGPALINRNLPTNLPALGCPAFSPNVLAINQKSTVAVAREEKPSIFKRFVKKIYDSTNSVSTKILFCYIIIILIQCMILELCNLYFPFLPSNKYLKFDWLMENSHIWTTHSFGPFNAIYFWWSKI